MICKASNLGEDQIQSYNSIMTFSIFSQNMIRPTDCSRSVAPSRVISETQRRVLGRRHTLSLLIASVAATLSESGDSRKAFLQEYLERSKRNKEKNDKERLDGYYRRNYKDYFDLVEGSNEGKKDEELSEAEKGIRDWLRANK